jgi:hypothetical protein
MHQCILLVLYIFRYGIVKSYSRSLSSLFFMLLPLLSLRHPWNALFHSSFFNPKTVARTPWTGDLPVARPLPIQTQNKCRQTSMPWVRFEFTIPVFQRAKTVQTLDREATVVNHIYLWTLMDALLPNHFPFLIMFTAHWHMTISGNFQCYTRVAQKVMQHFSFLIHNLFY